MFSTLDSFIKLRVFPVGRRLFALHGMRALAEERDMGALRTRIERAIRHDEDVTLQKMAAWRAQKLEHTPSPDGHVADRRVDEVMSGLHRHLGLVPALHGEDSEAARSAARLREKFFPGGLRPIVHATWVEEVAEGRRVVQLARGGDLRPHVARLGLEDALVRLASAVEDLNGHLRNDPVLVTYEEVRAADKLGQGYLLAVVAKVLGDYADDDTTCAALLAPVADQDRDIVSYQRRRRAVPDVNPRSGEPVWPEAAPTA